MDSARVVPGRLIRVWNKGHEKNDPNDDFHYTLWVEDANGKNERCIILTPKMLAEADQLAKDNPEDLTEKSFIQNVID